MDEQDHMTEHEPAPQAEPSGATEQTSSQEVTEGSASSAETDANPVIDEFLKTYGQKDDAPAADPEPAAEENVEEQAAPETEEQDEEHILPKKEFDALTPAAKARIGSLSKQKRQLTAEVERFKGIAESYTASHEAMAKLHAFNAENNLSAADVSNGLSIMAMLQTADFGGFLDRIMPFVEMAQRATGKALAPDVKALVEAGEMTMEAGLALTKARSDAALANATAQREVEARQARETADDRTKAVQELATAVRETEAVLRAQDPSYALKEPAIRAQFAATMQFLREQGALPKTKQGVADLIRKIHANVVVNQPARPRTVTAQPETASPSSPRRPEPRNTLELLEQSLGIA
ncbi:MAG: hypothetical protein KAX54_00280 [Thauera sp.]|nr:hypothetical protein [Thauera sp.]